MSEEVKDVSKYVPIAITWGYIGNGLLALVLLIAYLFSIPSLDDALNGPTGFPFIYVFQNCVSSWCQWSDRNHLDPCHFQ
jgi:amino acid transporter